VTDKESGEVIIDRVAGVADNIKAADKEIQDTVLNALIHHNPVVTSMNFLNLLPSTSEVNNALVKRLIQQVTFMEKADYKLYVSAKTITQQGSNILLYNDMLNPARNQSKSSCFITHPLRHRELRPTQTGDHECVDHHL
jgi:hypothetical protein